MLDHVVMKVFHTELAPLLWTRFLAHRKYSTNVAPVRIVQLSPNVYHLLGLAWVTNGTPSTAVNGKAPSSPPAQGSLACARGVANATSPTKDFSWLQTGPRPVELRPAPRPSRTRSIEEEVYVIYVCESILQKSRYFFMQDPTICQLSSLI